MTGINYDDLQSYLYVSEDHGKNWKSIAAGLPDEPVNVIIEDPVFENILYAGSLRGVYITFDRGTTWAYLGSKMPGTAVADLEIHEGTLDLIAGTHGRGIYKINLRPIHEMIQKKLSPMDDHLLTIPVTYRPWHNSAGGEPDTRTGEKADIAFWLSASKSISLSIRDKDNKVVWSDTLAGHAGYNQYRWTLVIKRQKSNLPYFVDYEKFIEAGSYTLVLSDGKLESEQVFVVNNGVSPYKK